MPETVPSNPNSATAHARSFGKAIDSGSGYSRDGQRSSRLLSLDVFRGMTIAAMITVNNTGNGKPYRLLRHADWNSWTPTDLVFPFFLFIVGVSMMLSFQKRREKGDTPAQILKHSAVRALIILALGIFLSGFPFFNLQTWRFYGVLQRTAICYIVASLLSLYTSVRVRAWICAVILTGYYAVLRFFPVPGFGMPGRDVSFLDKVGNLAAWLDRLLMPGRLYERTRDPEGLLSTFPAIVTVLAGVFVGEWLLRNRNRRSAPKMLACVGAIAFFTAEILHIWFPINKKMWTSSFVLMAAGLAMIVFAGCYWMLDVKQFRSRLASFFLVFGTNAIFAYTVAELISGGGWAFRSNGQPWLDLYFEAVPGKISNPQIAALAYSMSFVLLCFFLTWLLYRKRIFLKI